MDAFICTACGMQYAPSSSPPPHCAICEEERQYVPPGGVVVVDGWLDATSLAYGAYADRSLPERIIVSGYEVRKTALYASWAKDRPVFVLTDPRYVPLVPGARTIALLDAYHQLFRMGP